MSKLVVATTNVEFVRTVKRYPCVYDTYHSEYGKRNSIDSAWTEIAEKFQCTVKECTSRWRHLRNVYVRKLNRAPSDATGPYYLDQEINFIKPFVRNHFKAGRVSEPNLAISRSPMPPARTPSVEVEILDEVQHDLIDIASSPGESAFPEKDCTKKRKIESQETDKSFDEYRAVVVSSNSIVNTSSDSNTRNLFVMSLIPEINEMPEDRFRIFKRRVLGLIDDILTKDPLCL